MHCVRVLQKDFPENAVTLQDFNCECPEMDICCVRLLPVLLDFQTRC